MFVRNDERLQSVRPGTTFRRVHPHNLVETAEILAVSTDDAGIPHVRFSVTYQRPGRAEPGVEQRTLALRTFADRYRD
jgi:hypothetical protein